MTRRGTHLLAALACGIGAVLLFLTAPHDGDFWWSDAPRHALNGVFVKDLLATLPRHPAAWAMQYYVQYPALTILFYPPLFYLISAPFDAVLGVSHASALVVVLLHFFALAFGLYLLARCWLRPAVALAVGLSAMAAPGIALWGRQVMLEVPTLAFAVWALLVLRWHAQGGRPALLYLGGFLLLCAVYTKITTAFLAPVAAAMLFTAQGPQCLRSRHTWIAAALFAVGLMPVALLTWKFGAANMQSVVGIADSTVSRRSLDGWLWYARQMPGQLGWPLLAAALAGVAVVLRGNRDADRRGLSRADLVLLAGWLIVGYVFFSLIDLKEARHSTLILPPLLIAAGLAADRLLPATAGGAAALLLVGITAYGTWRYAPVPAVAGYREAAAWVAREAPPEAVILFSGKRDGSFIFNLRTIEARRDLYTLRADKLLLDVAVRRELGVTQHALSGPEIDALLDRDGVSYVVAQSDFWTDLAVMAQLQSVLRSPHFEEVQRIPVVANVPTEDKELRIYRNRHDISHAGADIRLDLPIIGRSVAGRTPERPPSSGE